MSHDTLKTETTPVWQTLSLPSDNISAGRRDYVTLETLRLSYIQKGKGPDVVLLHGGLGRSDMWQEQFDILAQDFRVTAIDSRAHGRSTRDTTPLSIHLMAEDISKAMTALGITSAAIVGWSDGGNIGLDLALNHPEQVRKLVTFGANFSPEGARPTAGTDPLLGAYVSAMAAQYATYSITDENFESFSSEVFRMWAEEPNFTPEQLRSITAPTLILHGRHEEAILLSHSQEMHAYIPNSQLKVLENVSHFAMWQDPDSFNAALLGFLK